MSDSYLAISQIANDLYMGERMRACYSQQQLVGNVPQTPSAGEWVGSNNYRWASSPTWGEKWDYALALHPDDPDYHPGADAAVITDPDILATVQYLAMPAADPEPESAPEPEPEPQ